MREWPYAKEPFDTKLFVLRFIKKIHWVLIGMLIGAVLVGGGYYIKKVVLGGPVEYEITTTYYIEYANMNPETGELHNYINDATWREWVVTDWFVDRVWLFASESTDLAGKYNVQKEDLKTYFFGDLPSDVRIPISRVTTPDKELTSVLNEALQRAYFVFAEEHSEMSSIEIINETPVQEADKDVRLLRAIILGTVIGGFVAAFALSLRLIWDDTIILPETFRFRYDIPMVGYLGKGDGAWKEETKNNLEYLFANEASKVLLTMGDKQKAEVLIELLGKGYFTDILSVKELDEKGYKLLRETGGILLAVGAEEHHGKAIEYTLEELKLQDCKVKAAVLYDADSTLIKGYRFGKNQK